MPDYPLFEQDWRLFRQKVPGWQEDFMDRLNREYIALLTGEGAASEKFWALHDRIRRDRDRFSIQIRMSRTRMWDNLTHFLREGVITPEDLDGFSDELRERVRRFLEA